MGKYLIVVDALDDAQVVEKTVVEGTQWSDADSPLKVTIAIELTLSGTNPITVSVFDENEEAPLMHRAYEATSESYGSDGLAVEDDD